MIQLINRDTYIISDHHLDHKNAFEFEQDRLIYRELGFNSFEDMIIHNHNSVVKNDDLVVFLGDFAFSNPQNWIHKFNGKKILILGNHDRKGVQPYFGFDYVVRGIEIDYNGLLLTHKNEDNLLSGVIIVIDNKQVGLCHYPVGDDDYNDRKNDIIKNRLKIIEPLFDSFSLDCIIHGHIHSNDYCTPEKHFTKLINASCEKLKFTPVKIGALLDEYCI